MHCVCLWKLGQSLDEEAHLQHLVVHYKCKLLLIPLLCFWWKKWGISKGSASESLPRTLNDRVPRTNPNPNPWTLGPSFLCLPLLELPLLRTERLYVWLKKTELQSTSRGGAIWVLSGSLSIQLGHTDIPASVLTTLLISDRSYYRKACSMVTRSITKEYELNCS